MSSATNHPSKASVRRRYNWPWFVLAAFIAAVLLSVLWLSFEVKRTQRIRDLNSTAPQGGR